MYKPNELIYINIQFNFWETAIPKTPYSTLSEILDNHATEKYFELLSKITNKPNLIKLLYGK